MRANISMMIYTTDYKLLTLESLCAQERLSTTEVQANGAKEKRSKRIIHLGLGLVDEV